MLAPMSARRCNRSDGDALQLQRNAGSVLSVPTNDVIWRKAWWRWQRRLRYLHGSNGCGIVANCEQRRRSKGAVVAAITHRCATDGCGMKEGRLIRAPAKRPGRGEPGLLAWLRRSAANSQIDHGDEQRMHRKPCSFDLAAGAAVPAPVAPLGAMHALSPATGRPEGEQSFRRPMVTIHRGKAATAARSLRSLLFIDFFGGRHGARTNAC